MHKPIERQQSRLESLDHQGPHIYTTLHEALTNYRSEAVHEVRWQLINEVSKKCSNIRKGSEIIS